MAKSVDSRAEGTGQRAELLDPCPLTLDPKETLDPNKKAIAQRACVGCRKVQDKQAMIRVVRTPEGIVKLDMTGKAAGRGAYLFNKPESLKVALKRRQFDRAFKTKVPADIYDRITEELERGENGE